MKKILSLLIIFSFMLCAYGQENEMNSRYQNNSEINTLFGRNKISSGGYGGFGVGYSSINNKDAIITTARGAWIIGHGLAIGFAGTGFMNSFQYDPVLDADVNLTGGYGGLLVEPILMGRFPVHLSFPVIAGIGGVAYTSSQWTNDPWGYQESWIEDYTNFFILEPGVELEFNVLKFFRFAFGLSYRMTSDISLMSTPPTALNGLSGGMTFKFGKF
ncbi:MAG: hypothetical protein K9H49_07270 [Bacteroidales bacterium]|nr:hypothetical protein [Bacteroidales bacterium]MCF8390312.1 hypothetical protein [Bacteroidales bacterium]